MRGLSTKHVVLGLLHERRGYGYDLKQRIEARFGHLALNENTVYKVLDRLEADGWIESSGDRRSGRRGAPRVTYQVTGLGRRRFKEWLATPCERTVLRDELGGKLKLAGPDDLPVLLAVAEQQHRDSLAELAAFARPVLADVVDPEVPWHRASVLMVDDLELRWLQGLVDWLDAICTLMEERLERIEGGDRPPTP